MKIFLGPVLLDAHDPAAAPVRRHHAGAARQQGLAFEAAVPLGFALVVVRTIQAMRRDLADLRAGREAYAGKALFDE